MEYASICEFIVTHTDDMDLGCALASSISRMRLGDALSRLQLTAKTHKGPGNFSFRAIHSTPCSPWILGMRLVSHWLRPKRMLLDHLLWSSEQLCAELRVTRFPRDRRFYMVDIKEFFYDGRTSFTC